MKILISITALLLPALLSAQSAASLKGTFNAAAALDHLKNDDVIAFMTWHAGELPADALACVAARAPTAPTPEVMRIYSTASEKPGLLTSHGEIGAFVSFFATRGTGGLLVTLWALSETRMKVVVFAYRDHDVHAVLEAESEGLPEFVRMAGDGEPAVRVTAAAGGKAVMPVQALYRWNGKNYLPVRALRPPASVAPRNPAASAPKP